MRRLMRPRLALLALPLLLSAVSGCGERVRLPTPSSVSAADLKAVTEAKPVPSDEILTDGKAADRYNAAVEIWGERLWYAGARICRALVADGLKLPFECPPASRAPTTP